MNYGRDVVEATLASIGVDVIRENKHGWGIARCPLHNDNDPSFVVHMEEGGWRCRAGCGSSGDLAELVEAVNGTPVVDARRDMIKSVAPSVELLERILAGHDDIPDPEPVVGPYIYDRSQAPAYMIRRGFSAETLKAWQVGWDPDDRSAVIPGFWESGEMAGLIRRRIDGREPKYLYTEDFPKSDILFGLHMCDDRREVVLVEGPMDAMWVNQLGYNAVATLGGPVSATQAQIIRRRFWKVKLGGDADRAGRAFNVQAADALAGLIVSVIRIPEEINQSTGRLAKDLPECSAMSGARAIDEAIPFVMWTAA